MDDFHETELSDFESEEFDKRVDEILTEKRKERIKQLREDALHTIQVSFFSTSQFFTNNL